MVRFRELFVASALMMAPYSGAGLQALAQEGPSEGSLAGLIEAFEKTEKELAEAREHLKTARTAAERRRLQGRIKDLEEEQRRLLPELEKLAGPLPPAVRPQPTNPLVDHLEVQRLRNEALQDREAESRLSGQ